MSKPDRAQGRPVFVLLEELMNGERIPMGVPNLEGKDFLEHYAAFAFVDEDGAKAEKAGLVDFDKDYDSSVSIVPGMLADDGTLTLEDRVWTLADILSEHGVDAPQP